MEYACTQCTLEIAVSLQDEVLPGVYLQRAEQLPALTMALLHRIVVLFQHCKCTRRPITRMFAQGMFHSSTS